MVLGPRMWFFFRDSGKQEKERKNVIVSTEKRDFHNTSFFFYSWCNKAIVFYSEDVVIIK